MASDIRVTVDDPGGLGVTIRWREQGFERHVWVQRQVFEGFLARGTTTYLDTPALATARLGGEASPGIATG